MQVRQAMHEGLLCVSGETMLPEVARHMRDEDIGAVPVIEGERIIGMITDRDIVLRAVADRRDPATLSARDVMTPGAVCCTAHDDIEDALQLMEDKTIRRLPVLDENERVVGMLSLGDISHAVPDDLTADVVKAVSAHHR